MKITDLFAPFADELQLTATPSLSNPLRVEWTSDFGDLFFRIKGADPQIVWCALGHGTPAKCPLSDQRLATLIKYISVAYAGRTFFRGVPFPLDVQRKLWRGIGVRGKEFFPISPTISLASLPAQHEKLEAALFWRDFGRGIVEIERVEAALAELLKIESSE